MKQLMAALAAAQDEFPKVKRDSKNPHFSSRYTSLEEAVDTIRPILRKHDLIVVQPASGNNGYTGCRTILYHIPSGEMLEETLLLPSNGPGKDSQPNAQTATAAVTYSRRTAYLAIVGAIQDDDDGNSAVARSSTKQTVKAAKKEEPPVSKKTTKAAKEPDASAGPGPEKAEIPAELPVASVYPTDEEYSQLRGRGTVIKVALDNAGLKDAGKLLGAYFMTAAKVESLKEIPKLTYEAILKKLETMTHDPKQIQDAVKLVGGK